MSWTEIPRFRDALIKAEEENEAAAEAAVSEAEEAAAEAEAVISEAEEIIPETAEAVLETAETVPETAETAADQDVSELNFDEMLELKEKICVEAEELAVSGDWKGAPARYEELLNSWKQIYYGGTEKERELWGRFCTAKKSFFENRELDRSKNKAAKRELIGEAEKLRGSTEWKKTGEAHKVLFERWKEIGSAGRGEDDALWKEFNAIRQDFFDRRHDYYEELNRQYQEHAQKKQEIVDEAHKIAESQDYSGAVTEQMMNLDRSWKEIGYAGKEHEDKLWSLFQAAKDVFWTGKRADNERKQQEWRRNLQEAIGRKKEQITNLETQIGTLEYKMIGMKNQEYIDNMVQWVAEKRARIEELEASIRDMESKM